MDSANALDDNETNSAVSSLRSVRTRCRRVDSVPSRPPDQRWDNTSDDSSRLSHREGPMLRNSLPTNRPLENGKRRRRSPLFFLRWMYLLVVVAVVRTVRNSALVTEEHTASRHVTNMLRNNSSPILPRQVRRPPVPSDSKPLVSTIVSSPAVQTVKLSEEQQFSQQHWKQLCGSGSSSLSSKSRVLVSGVLSHSVASELVVALARECRVKTIVGLSDHALDADAIQRMSFLFQRLPRFQLHKQTTPFSQEKVSEIVKSLAPTHVIHLEQTSFLPPSALEGVPVTTAVRMSIRALETLCNAVASHQEHSSRMIRFLFLTVDGPTDSYKTKAADQLYPVLLQTYRARRNLDTMQLKLHPIYGPFRESIAEKSIAGTGSLDRKGQEGSGHVLHLSDALQTVVATWSKSSSALGTSPLPSFVPPSSRVTSLASVERRIQMGNMTSASVPVDERLIQFLLAWKHKFVHPYEDSSVHGKPMRDVVRRALRLSNKYLASSRLDGISQEQRRQDNLFPCVSECSVQVNCRTSSPMASIQLVSRNITDDCRFVLYTVDFSRELDSIPMMRESNVTVPWPKDQLCQVAFVSRKSKLVKATVEAEKARRPKDHLHTATLNGNVQHNQWTLVWADHDDTDTMLESDFVMPKIAPGNFFSKNVTKGFYIETDHSEVFPPVQAIWFLMSKYLDSRRQKARTTTMRRSGTSVDKMVNVAEIPARHVVLFAHAFDMPKSLRQENDAKDLARFVLEQKGMSLDRTWPERQLELYDYAKESLDYMLVDTFMLIHNLQSERSRRLRCEWYEEHLFWANDGDKRNRHLEDLSLAFILAKWRSEARLTKGDYSADWGERIVDSARGDLPDSSPNSTLSSHYHVKLHPPLRQRRRYPEGIQE